MANNHYANYTLPNMVISLQIHHGTEYTNMPALLYLFNINSICIILNNTILMVQHSYGTHQEV